MIRFTLHGRPVLWVQRGGFGFVLDPRSLHSLPALPHIMICLEDEAVVPQRAVLWHVDLPETSCAE